MLTSVALTALWLLMPCTVIGPLAFRRYAYARPNLGRAAGRRL
jgi:hypothetical protein